MGCTGQHHCLFAGRCEPLATGKCPSVTWPASMSQLVRKGTTRHALLPILGALKAYSEQLARCVLRDTHPSATVHPPQGPPWYPSAPRTRSPPCSWPCGLSTSRLVAAKEAVAHKFSVAWHLLCPMVHHVASSVTSYAAVFAGTPNVTFSPEHVHVHHAREGGVG